MIVIDTNVVSEMMRDEPDQRVLTWSETVGPLHTTAIALAGRPIATADAQIAAICATREATLATRHTDDFERTGIDVINPWNG